MKKKICFVFGAGAEASYKICSGDEFAEKIIRFEGKSGLAEEAIKEYYARIIKEKSGCGGNNWYPDYHSSSLSIDKLLKSSIVKKFHEDGIISDTRAEFKSKVEEKASTYKTDLAKREFIFKHPNYMGILDENFHTLISPKTLGPHKFWRVIATYTAAYLYICADILGVTDDKDCYLEMLNDPLKNYENILATIRQEKVGQNSYYKVLGNYLAKVDPKIVTTNHTPLCECVLDAAIVKDKTGLKFSERISYIHGKLSWFECPYTLQVYDLHEPNDGETQVAFNNYILFPYIFIQSGVKPVVERNQLEEYSKALKHFSESEEIVIIGYRLNVDDNHLNSLLHSYNLREGKKITYFAYGEDKSTLSDLEKRLRIPQGKSARIEIINIDKNNGIEKFETYLASVAGSRAG